MDKISLHWSIKQDHREAQDDDLLLVTTNGRTDGGFGPVRWSVFWINECDERVLLVEGETWQGTRYSSLVRQAMFDAEQEAKAVA